MITIYAHPRCADSYHIWRLLQQNLLLDSVKFINTQNYPLSALEHSVYSVPAFATDEKVVLQGFFTDEEVLELVKTGYIKVEDEDIAYQRLVKSIFSSFLTASIVYLQGTFEPLIYANQYLLSASGASFLPFERQRKFLELAYTRLKELKVTTEDERKFFRIIAGNFLRDLYWLKKRKISREILESIDESYFYDWFMQRVSLGRVFVPHSQSLPPESSERIRKAWNYTLERFDVLLSKVREEQESIPENWL
mgnify:CR=1 FL=1